MLRFELHNETLAALPERALWHERSGTLYVADLHLGKSSAFRVAGIPVPETTARTLDRLLICLSTTGAERVVILGDFLHAPTGRTAAVMDAFAAWRTKHAQLNLVLIRGNHDERSGLLPDHWNIPVQSAPCADDHSPFVLAHMPEELVDAGFGLCGHIHPAISLSSIGGFAGPHPRGAPCLWITDSHAVLPAFGDFTGGRRIALGDGDRAIVFIDGEVVAAPTRRARC